MGPAHPLAPYGWNERVQALTEAAGQDLRPGRVARVDRGWLSAVTESGWARLPNRGMDVTTGDWILLSPDEPPAVGEVLPRWSALGRHGPGRAGVRQLLAANLDVGFVVVGLDRGANLPRLDRLLTLVWSSGAQPVVVLAKSDLVAEHEQIATALRRATVGVEIVVTSSVDGRGVGRLREFLPQGDTAVVLGESGGGKSSLVNALVDADVQSTGAVRVGDAKGRHTTRARELVPLPGGGVLLDTPGIRAVALAAGQEDALDHTFADVVELAAACRFADCRHDAEPDCAVQAAIAGGALDGDRLASFRTLQHEARAAARRTSGRPGPRPP